MFEHYEQMRHEANARHHDIIAQAAAYREIRGNLQRFGFQEWIGTILIRMGRRMFERRGMTVTVEFDRPMRTGNRPHGRSVA